jgi:glycosyltransferase involved in cell wall biosynthesis
LEGHRVTILPALDNAATARPAPVSLRPGWVGKPKRILMTVDAIGGVWRYAMDLASAFKTEGVETVFAGFGPLPSPVHSEEAKGIGTLVWLKAPLDWMVEGGGDLNDVPHLLQEAIEDFDIDLVHLNLPSQAHGLKASVPVVVVSHSCVVTWFHAVRGSVVPEHWRWQEAHNRAGFDLADAVVVPSRSHGAMVRDCYGELPRLTVIPNASSMPATAQSPRRDFVLAAGRWWDDGKNGSVLDRAAAMTDWPVVMAGPTVGPAGQTVTLEHARSPGELQNRDVRRLMLSAGIFASPSIYEPFGLAALEAARAGTAMVLADMPTYRELWEGAAVFADPRDPSSFARAINELAANPAQRTELGRAALIRSERFSLETQSRAYLDLYNRILARSPQLATAM